MMMYTVAHRLELAIHDALDDSYCNEQVNDVVHCIAHRLELVIKDALKDSYFNKQISFMIMYTVLHTVWSWQLRMP